MNTQRISVILTALSLFLCTSLAAPDVQAATYSFTTLDVPGATETRATNINASGQVTGYYWDDAGGHGFVYSNGALTTLDVPGAVWTFATSINASGQVTGYYYSDGSSHGFLYSNGTFTTFDVPGTTSTHATSINASSQVAGYYYSDGSTHGFLYSNGTFTTFDVPGASSTQATSINDGGQVTGYDTKSEIPYPFTPNAKPLSKGFVYSGGTFTSLDIPGPGPDSTSTFAFSINNSGQVTGTYCYVVEGQCRGSHGFVYSGGTLATLNVPGAGTYATSINASGQVTGYYSGGHGFVYADGAFTTLDVPGAALGTYPTSINDSGQVTGTYRNDWGTSHHGFIATPVCATPTVTIHTLTTAPSGFRITGSITQNGAPLCALILANGQFLFTCGDPLPKGEFDLTVPPDDQGQITLFGFSSGLAPFQQTLGPDALPASVNATSCATPKVTYTTAAAPEGRFRLTGSITLGGDPLCALVLANGQFMFTCGDALPKGDFDLTAPLDDQGQITLFGFSSGLAPFQQTFSPSSPTPP